MEELFRGARRKIKRANQHIYHLNEIFDAFLNSDFHNFSVQKDPETGQHFLEISVAPMPEDIPLILGDAIHNLRTSLDFIAAEIATIAKRPVRYAKFPFRETREELVTAIKDGLKETTWAPPSVVSAIVDEVKPYKGGNDALCALHDLDITDKHLLIVPVVSVATISNVDLTYGSVRIYGSVHLRGGRKICMAGGPPGGPDLELQIQNKGQPVCEIILQESEVFRMQPVIPVLHQLSQIVSGCVDAIAKAYLTGS